MKKTMLLGMALLTMVFGATGCGNKAEVEANHLTDEQIIAAMLYEDYGVHVDNIEISEYTGDRYDDEGIQRIDDDFVNYYVYDEDGYITYIGGVDLSCAEQWYCE